MSGLAVPFTLFWLIGSCNAFNFIDGLDGLASGIGLIVSLVYGTHALVNEGVYWVTSAGTLLMVALFLAIKESQGGGGWMDVTGRRGPELLW